MTDPGRTDTNLNLLGPLLAAGKLCRQSVILYNVVFLAMLSTVLSSRPTMRTPLQMSTILKTCTKSQRKHLTTPTQESHPTLPVNHIHNIPMIFKTT